VRIVSSSASVLKKNKSLARAGGDDLEFPFLSCLRVVPHEDPEISKELGRARVVEKFAASSSLIDVWATSWTSSKVDEQSREGHGGAQRPWLPSSYLEPHPARRGGVGSRPRLNTENLGRQRHGVALEHRGSCNRTPTTLAAMAVAIGDVNRERLAARRVGRRCVRAEKKNRERHAEPVNLRPISGCTSC